MKGSKMSDTTTAVAPEPQAGGENLNDALDSAFDGAFEAPEKAAESAPEAAGGAQEAGEAPEAKEDEKTAPEGKEDDEDDPVLGLTPQELAEIKSSPALSKLYKSLNKGYTQKYQQIAADRQFLEQVRANPKAVLLAAAQNMGLKVLDPQEVGTQANTEAVVDETMQSMVQLFGPDLAPAVEPVMRRMIQNIVDSQVAPLRQTQEALQQQSFEKQAQAYAGTFRARHADLTPEVEAKMIEIGNTIYPNEGISPDQYLEVLYTIATAGGQAQKVAKVAAERIKAAQSSAEPRRGAAPVKTGGSKVRKDMSLDEAFDAAWAEASEQS
jgi:hypothetical protein